MEVQIPEAGQAGPRQDNHGRTSGARSAEHQLPSPDVVETPGRHRTTEGPAVFALFRAIGHRSYLCADDRAQSLSAGAAPSLLESRTA